MSETTVQQSATSTREQIWLNREQVRKEKTVYRALKRAQDIFFSLLALIVLSPLLLIVAIAIVIDDPKGSPVFTQVRSGLDGKEFRIHKYYKNVCDELLVNQLLPAAFDGYDFPGYDEVRLTWKQLEIIIKQHKKDWMAALQNQKAVYLITDRSNGKLYVGSATSDNGMLLQRWANYIDSGHGGNKELIELVNKEGIDYIKRNFQYSILENYNAKMDDSVILERESWWKETLQSRKFGYNAN